MEQKLDELLKEDAAAVSISYEITTPQQTNLTRSNSATILSDYDSPQDDEYGLFGEEEEGGSEDEFAGELELMVQEADTPIPTPQETQEDDSDESDSEEEIQERGVEKEKMKIRREQEIIELEETIFQKRISVLGLVNPIVRERALNGLMRLEGELELKRSQLEEEE